MTSPFDDPATRALEELEAGEPGLTMMTPPSHAQQLALGIVRAELERLRAFEAQAKTFAFSVQTALGDKHSTLDGMLDEILWLAREERKRQEENAGIKKRFTVHYYCRACETGLLDDNGDGRRAAGWHEHGGQWFCPDCVRREREAHK